MIRRGIWFILVALIAIILGAAYWVWNYDDEKGSKQVLGVFATPQNQMSIEQFMEFSKGHKITRTEVLYVPFGTESPSLLSEEDILAGPCIVVVSGSFLKPYPRHIAAALNDFKGEKCEEEPTNFRYCCLMYSGSDKVIRFSLGASHSGINLLYINGIPYKVDLNVINAFLKLLPVTDYELAIQIIKEGGINIESDI